MLMLKLDVTMPDGSSNEKLVELTAAETSALLSKLKAAQTVMRHVLISTF